MKDSGWKSGWNCQGKPAKTWCSLKKMFFHVFSFCENLRATGGGGFWLKRKPGLLLWGLTESKKKLSLLRGLAGKGDQPAAGAQERNSEVSRMDANK